MNSGKKRPAPRPRPYPGQPRKEPEGETAILFRKAIRCIDEALDQEVR